MFASDRISPMSVLHRVLSWKRKKHLPLGFSHCCLSVNDQVFSNHFSLLTWNVWDGKRPQIKEDSVSGQTSLVQMPQCMVRQRSRHSGLCWSLKRWSSAAFPLALSWHFLAHLPKLKLSIYFKSLTIRCATSCLLLLLFPSVLIKTAPQRIALMVAWPFSHSLPTALHQHTFHSYPLHGSFRDPLPLLRSSTKCNYPLYPIYSSLFSLHFSLPMIHIS